MGNEVEYERAINNLLTLAERELYAFLGKLDYSKPYECKQAVKEFAYYLGKKYEGACQEVTRLEYIAMRGGTSDGYEVQVCEGMSDEAFMSGIDYYCKYLFGEQANNE